VDLTIPYTFYPTALPGWISWALFLTVLAGGGGAGLAVGWRRGLGAGLRVSAGSVALLPLATMILGMIITFFLHDG